MKLYIFDLGGVCVFNFQTVGKIAQKYNINEKLLLDDYMKNDMSLMDGSLSTKQWWLSASRKFNIKNNFDDPAYDLFTPYKNEVVLNIIKELKAQGKRVVCGSNTCDPHWSKMDACGDLSNLFDKCYLSQRMHIAKPNLAFFEYILKSENVNAEDAIFIDDSKANVEAAIKTGMKGLWFHDEFAWGAVDKLREVVIEDKIDLLEKY